MVENVKKSIVSDLRHLIFSRSLILKVLVPTLIITLSTVCIFGFFISTKTKEDSKNFLIQNVLMPEFELLANEKNNDFERIKNLTEFTAQKIEMRIASSKNRTDEEVNALFNKFVSKKPDGSYRSNLDKLRGRFQMAAFHNNIMDIDIREKGIFADAFLYFDPFCESQMPFIFTTYFATKNSIWQYGFPEWALTSAANETFDKYGWFYGADPEHDPKREQVWTDMYYDSFQAQWMISSLMPVYDNEEFIGIVGQDFILQKIIEITKKSSVGETGTLFFIDNLGNIIAHPDNEFLIGKKAANDETLNLKTLPDKALTKVLQNLPNENGFKFTGEDNRRIVMYFPLNSVNWKMIYAVSEEEFLKIATQANNQYLISFVVFALSVIVFMILMITFMLIQPIKKLTNTVEDISMGKLDVEVDSKLKESKDEIGDLARAFDRTIISLKLAMKQTSPELKKKSDSLIKLLEEKEKTEKTLKESEKKYRTLIEQLPQKIFLKDKNSIYVSCNENYAKDLKLKPNEIVGKTDYDFYPKELAEKYIADDKEVMKSGVTKDIDESYIQDGKKIFVHTVKTPVKDDKGNIIGIIGIFWDVTEQKKWGYKSD